MYIYIYFFTLWKVVLCLGNIFYCFLWRPLSCGGPWATAQFVPSPLKSGPARIGRLVHAAFITETTKLDVIFDNQDKSLELCFYSRQRLRVLIVSHGHWIQQFRLRNHLYCVECMDLKPYSVQFWLNMTITEVHHTHHHHHHHVR